MAETRYPRAALPGPIYTPIDKTPDTQEGNIMQLRFRYAFVVVVAAGVILFGIAEQKAVADTVTSTPL